MEEKHQMKQRVKKQTGSSLQTHIITAQVGNISVLEADVLQVGH
jgi:3-deoxy-D-arabino-heptulosonate 7-phosphate (DAHP) synthase